MSTKSYNFIHDDLGFALPSKSPLRWRSVRYVVPALDANVMTNLSKVVFNEVVIKSDLVYNRVSDISDGFVDFEQGQREPKIGNKCCFFMEKGLCAKWKYVFSNYVSKGDLGFWHFLPICKKKYHSTQEHRAST